MSDMWSSQSQSSSSQSPWGAISGSGSSGPQHRFELVHRIRLTPSTKTSSNGSRQRLSARWLIDSAHSAAISTMRREAIDFYNQLAEKWNDEMGWAERRLITTSLDQRTSSVR